MISPRRRRTDPHQSPRTGHQNRAIGCGREPLADAGHRQEIGAHSTTFQRGSPSAEQWRADLVRLQLTPSLARPPRPADRPHRGHRTEPALHLDTEPSALIRQGDPTSRFEA